MGRETRQARRARERREQELRRSNTARNRRNWAVAGAIGVIVVALLVFAAHTLASVAAKSTTASGLVPTPKEAPGKVIDGVVGCGSSSMAPGYHVHMHLAMYDAGKPVTVPALVGFNTAHDCLYWLHTHDTTGIIHLESPSHLVPTLGNFFDVWGQPLSTTQMATKSVKPGQRMEVFVNMKPYNGNPRGIRLTPHATITIEIGPPFVKPQPFNFGTL